MRKSRIEGEGSFGAQAFWATAIHTSWGDWVVLEQGSADDLNLAFVYFRQGIEKDPQYAPRYAGLAAGYGIELSGRGSNGIASARLRIWPCG